MTPCLTTGPRTAVVRFVFTALLFLSAGSARAQEGLLPRAPGRVDVVALMVEFQPDTTRFTTGNGTFDGPLFPGVDAPKIDPLPHNGAYFDAHLRFLEHYVRRVSDARTEVTTHLLPEVIRVSKPMGAYSPTGHESGSDAELTKLSALVKEAWTAADQSSMTLPAGLDPATTAFVIFHAGVGRDIELVGTTLDKTPEDLPSIFFGASTLHRLGTSGISMDGFPISNSLIIPRTESRLGVNPLTQEPFLIELSINGMLAASFFNWLGVPDLFNTEDGSSAIGPFGLMDALGIFAYSGLFPPEPSAWTKQVLGWADQFRPRTSDETFEIRHAGDEGRNEAVRIPITGSEYFLVENRHRDPDGDGVRLQVWTHEGEQEVVFANGDPEFNDRTVTGFPGGVVLSVDDYDFALPGGVDEDDNPLLGGILIWHIDEQRLAAGLPENRVNADPNARAIDLEEADGAQDIGFGTGGGLFSANFDLGTPFDFWYEGNPVTVRTATGQDIRLYENRFASDTEPSSLNNGGGLSGIELSDFSPVAPLMSFSYRAGAAGELAFLGQTTFESLLIDGASGPASLMTDGSGSGFWSWQDGYWQHDSSCWGNTTIRPVPVEDGLLVLADHGLWLWNDDDCSHPTRLVDLGTGSLIWTTPSMATVRFPGELRLFAGVHDEGGAAMLTFRVHDDGRVDHERTALAEPALHLFVAGREGGQVLVVTEAGIRDHQGTMLLPADLTGISEAAMAGAIDAWTLAWTSTTRPGVVHLVSSENEQSSIHPAGACAPRFLSWRDLDDDGLLDLSFACGSTVQAVHASGAVMDAFPLRFAAPVAAQPVFARDTSGRLLAVVSLESGYVDGRRLESSRWDDIAGFPAAVGQVSGAAPLLDGSMLTVLDARGGRLMWQFASADATRVVDSDLITPVPDQGTQDLAGNRLLVEEETYNWPNPIRSGETRIRFAVQETSAIEIDIVDQSGMRVDHLEVDAAPGGIPTEIIWQTSAGSGVYLARVKARSLSSGRTDARLIRMAIIR